MIRSINLSSDCAKSELDLFSVPPTNTSIESGGWSQHQPIAIIENGPIEFNITGTDNEYLHLNKTLLYLKISIVKPTNIGIEDKDPVGPVNNFASSLFSQVDVLLNNESVETSNKTYAYKAYISDLLNYSEDAKNSFMQSSLFYKDTAGSMDEANLGKTEALQNVIVNEGYLKRRSLVLNGSGSIDLLTKLHCDIFNTDRYLLNGVDLNIKLHRNQDAFCLLSTEKKKYSIKIENAYMLIRKAKISPSIILAHNLALEKATVKYPIKRVVVNSYTIPQNVQNFTTPNLSTTVLPLRVIVGMVESEAFNGSEIKNPFNFKHFGLRQITLTQDSKSIPYYKSLEFDFEKQKYVRGYFSLFEGIDKPVFINGNNISREDYLNGYTLIAFDISPDLCSGDHFNLLKTGNLLLDLVFDKGLSTSVSLIVFMEYDNMVEINKSRKVYKDYQI